MIKSCTGEEDLGSARQNGHFTKGIAHIGRFLRFRVILQLCAALDGTPDVGLKNPFGFEYLSTFLAYSREILHHAPLLN